MKELKTEEEKKYNRALGSFKRRFKNAVLDNLKIAEYQLEALQGTNSKPYK